MAHNKVHRKVAALHEHHVGHACALPSECSVQLFVEEFGCAYIVKMGLRSGGEVCIVQRYFHSYGNGINNGQSVKEVSHSLQARSKRGPPTK
jgi:hypothetical protein